FDRQDKLNINSSRLFLNFLITDLFFFSSRRRHTIFSRDWSSDVCSSDLGELDPRRAAVADRVIRAAVLGRDAHGCPRTVRIGLQDRKSVVQGKEGKYRHLE